jgi:hypothetical protein
LLRELWDVGGKMKAMYKFTVLTVMLFVCLSCSDKGAEMEISKRDAMSTEIIEKALQKRVYFGHQSVGDNILVGLNEIFSRHKVKLNINEFSADDKGNDYFIIHSRIGKNGDAYSKMESAKNEINQLKGRIDTALIKFCYIDIDEKTDTTKIFESYKKTVKEIKQSQPSLRIIHSTIPLTTTQKGLKALLKSLIGKPVGEAGPNIKRNEYNSLIRKEYGKAAIFDIAEIESTMLNGRIATFKKDGKEYPELVEDYTYDGGHLNALGKDIVAQGIILTIADSHE